MRQSQAKASPVSAKQSPVENIAQYVDLNTEKAKLEKQLTSLKPLMLDLIPTGQQSESYSALRDGIKGQYVVTRVERDSRKVNDEALMTLLQEKGLVHDGTSPSPDEAKITALVAQGRISKEEIAGCLTGSISTYPLVSWSKD